MQIYSVAFFRAESLPFRDINQDTTLKQMFSVY